MPASSSHFGALVAACALASAACAPDFGVHLEVDVSDPAAPVFDVPDRDAISVLVVYACATACPATLSAGDILGADHDDLARVWLLHVLGGDDALSYGPVIPLPVTYGRLPDAVAGPEPVVGDPADAPPLPPGDYLAGADAASFAFVAGEQSHGVAAFTIGDP